MSKIVYDRHDEEWQKCLNDKEQHKIALTWLEDGNTLDRWRHNRMYEFARQIVNYDNKYSWLTVGDGRYGTDAHALKKLGASKVMCTDISDSLLKVGHEKGFIEEYSSENAESLSFQDGQFDFVFCKEAYHHFPRPYIALYEMLRVSKVGVLLIEPRDVNIDFPLFNFIKSLVKKILGRGGDSSQHFFEPIGNYVFSTSEREMEKIQLGMHRQYISFNGVNDSYQEGVEFVDLDTTAREEKRIISRLKFHIKIKDFLCWLGLMKSDLLITILFKSQPPEDFLNLLKENKWNVKVLPKNPYV